jgi:hypothetical protein
MGKMINGDKTSVGTAERKIKFLKLGIYDRTEIKWAFRK